ncbi:MAG: hypothetical protein A3E83_05090 [Gammaproteobacteria bacterium RIFCSPHIGHO2_12_FULL_41_20]|nr:MAG: hypothetical protein A3E83_05090 [Gammaproteobacteria bacterium RIFCSPHIGHO2_12_FULL_41_20]
MESRPRVDGVRVQQLHRMAASGKINPDLWQYQFQQKDQRQALLLACYAGHAAVVDFLIDKMNVAIDQCVDIDGSTPLHAVLRGAESDLRDGAVGSGRERILERLETAVFTHKWIDREVRELLNHLNKKTHKRHHMMQQYLLRLQAADETLFGQLSVCERDLATGKLEACIYAVRAILQDKASLLTLQDRQALCDQYLNVVIATWVKAGNFIHLLNGIKEISKDIPKPHAALLDYCLVQLMRYIPKHAPLYPEYHLLMANLLIAYQLKIEKQDHSRRCLDEALWHAQQVKKMADTDSHANEVKEMAAQCIETIKNQQERYPRVRFAETYFGYRLREATTRPKENPGPSVRHHRSSSSRG